MPPGIVRLAVQRPLLRDIGDRFRTDFWEEGYREVPAGAADVSLVFVRGRTLTVHVAGWRPASGAGSDRVTLWAEGRGAVSSALLDDGRARFVDLPPELDYGFVFESEEGFAVLLGLRADDREVEVALRAWAKVSGRLLLPPGAREPWVRAPHVTLHPWAEVEPGGRFTMDRVPGLPCRLRAGALVAGRPVEREVTVEEGEEVVIDLR
jgi:hypothetical protein